MTVKIRKWNLALTSILYFTVSCSEGPHGTIKTEDVHVPVQTAEAGYGHLAADYVAPAYSRLLAHLSTFNNQTMPEDAKTLRKDIAFARELLDIFVYAYPKSEKRDIWLDLRNDLDEGHAVVGAFKDLFDMQQLPEGQSPAYDETLLKTLRKRCLDWQERTLKHELARNYSGYLSQPLVDAFERRHKEALSRFYWGSVAFGPDERLTGLDNVRRLLGALVEQAVTKFPSVLDIDDIVDKHQVETFHDYRKSIRLVVTATQLIPDLIPAESNAQMLKKELSQLVSDFGNLHDIIIFYDLAVREKDASKAASLRGKIQDQWNNLKLQSQEHQLDHRIAEFGQSVDGLIRW